MEGIEDHAVVPRGRIEEERLRGGVGSEGAGLELAEAGSRKTPPAPPAPVQLPALPCLDDHHSKV